MRTGFTKVKPETFAGKTNHVGTAAFGCLAKAKPSGCVEYRKSNRVTTRRRIAETSPAALKKLANDHSRIPHHHLAVARNIARGRILHQFR